MIIAIAGNPNCGKSSLFNLLTGGKQKVGNWPGVTVDKKIGKVKLKALDADLVDLPGIYALSAWSEDERISRDYLVSCEADLLINVVDSTNLERNLFLTLLLKKMGVQTLVVLNMMDIAKKQKIKINVEEMEKELGIPIVATSATCKADKYRILEGIEKIIAEKNAKVKIKLPPENADEYEVLAEDNYRQIESIMAKTVQKGVYVYTASDKVDKVVTNRYFGLPIFLVVMYLLFWLTMHVGSIFIDFFDIAFGAIFVDGFRVALQSVNAPEAAIVVLADGVGAGIQTLSTFFPMIFTLFFFIGLLESSGYMARAAFVMDRIMRFVGLPGKAFIPLLIGFGCAVPAIMATRTLENRRDRILSIFMVPFMSCGARLPIYVLFAAAFFSHNGVNMVFSLYIIGIVLAMITGLLLKNTVYKGTVTPFVMELPQYHAPTIKDAAINAIFRLKAFVRKAGRILVPIIAVLGILNGFGVLEPVGKAVSPVFEPIGIDRENWAVSVSLFSGLAAKEVIIGSLNSLYSQNSDSEKAEDFDLSASLAAACKSIPKNIRNVFNQPNTDYIAENEESLFTNMRAAFHNSKAAAFAFLLFVLLYVPCLSTISSSLKEVGAVIVALQAFYSTALGWCLATLFYQSFEGGSPFYITLSLVLLVTFVSLVLLYARKSGKFNS